jgi:hypothetical protein
LGVDDFGREPASVAPTAALYAHYGPFERVIFAGPGATEHLLVLTGTTLVAFALGLASSVLVHSARESTSSIIDVMSEVVSRLIKPDDKGAQESRVRSRS